MILVKADTHLGVPVECPVLTIRDIAPVLIVVVGWMASHALALRAQRKNFQNQVLDRARLEIHPRILAYQSWLSELSAWLRSLEYNKAAIQLGIKVDFHATARELLAFQMRKADMRAWSEQLEAYEILFPEMARARMRLDRRHLKITDRFSVLQDAFTALIFAAPTVEALEVVTTRAETLLGPIDDQSALLFDLQVHLQNATLSKVMNRKVPPRDPPDPDVPRLALMRDGKLEVVNADNEPLDAGPLILGGGVEMPEP